MYNNTLVFTAPANGDTLAPTSASNIGVATMCVHVCVPRCVCACACRCVLEEKEENCLICSAKVGWNHEQQKLLKED